MKGIITTILLISAINFANAKSPETLLLTIDNNIDKEIAVFSLALKDNGDAKHLFHRTYLRGKLIRTKKITLADAKEGAVIVRMSRRNIVTLKTDKFDAIKGGEARLIYMINAITRSYGRLNFDLIKQAGRWLIEVDGQETRKMTFYGNRKFPFGWVGIRYIKKHPLK